TTVAATPSTTSSHLGLRVRIETPFRFATSERKAAAGPAPEIAEDIPMTSRDLTPAGAVRQPPSRPASAPPVDLASADPLHRIRYRMIYCVIPRELAGELYDKMVEYYKDNPNVTVSVDRRGGPNRRDGQDA